MRRILCALILPCLLLSLCCCSSPTSEDDTVSFYYLREELAYDSGNGVIASEVREIARRSNDMEYLLSLYLSGPQDSGLLSPFPQGTQLVKATREKDHLTIEISEQLFQLSGLDLTLACACLCSTCFGLSDAEQVTITAPGQASNVSDSVTMTRDSLTFWDDSAAVAQASTETTTQ